MIRSQFCVWVALSIAAIAWSNSARAQDAEPSQAEEIAEDGGDKAAVLKPPALKTFVPAEYPQAAQDTGVAGEVVLGLVIQTDGTVEEAVVITSVSPELDAAALAAGKRLVFEPATQDDTPIIARIQFPYVFELTVEEPQTGVLKGHVRQNDEEPIPNAVVVATGADKTLRATTDEDGAFEFRDVVPGDYDVTVDGDVLGRFSAIESVKAGEETDVTYRLSATKADAPKKAAFSVTAAVEAPPREVTKRTIPKEQLTKIPGTRGDALRAVELLPGVGRPPGLLGALIVRGSAPGDSQVFLNSMPLPLLYHFGGLTSSYNSRLLERIDFIPGNFSARYGRKTGGILEVETRKPRTDAFHGAVELSLIDVSLQLEAPLGEHFSFAASARRSVIDFFFENVVPPDAFGVLAAPVYYDYQFILNWEPNDDHSLQLQFYGSDDRLRFLFDDAVGDNPQVRGSLNLATRYNLFHFRWDWNIDENWDLDVDIQFGPTTLDFSLGESLGFLGEFFTSNYRAELQGRLNRAMTLRVGMDINATPSRIDFRGPQPQQSEGSTNNNALATGEQVFFTTSTVAYRPAAYAELDTQLIDGLQILAGIRLDYYKEIREWTFDPRLMVGYQLTDTVKIKGGVGLYSQPAEFQETAPGIGNPNLEPIRSTHFGLGAEWKPNEQYFLGVDVFYKDLWQRVVSTPGGVDPRYTNDGVGRIYGMEVAGRIQPSDDLPLFAYLSYTLMRSERRDGPDQPWRLFDFDQTHIFTIAGVYKLPHGWEIGGTFRLVSGNPTTPIIGSVYDVRSDTFTPISGATNSTRNSLFHRLDIRVEKTWTFDSWKLAFFIDIQNIYNNQNQEGVQYNYDYSQSQPITGLPIIPALGLRGEL